MSHLLKLTEWESPTGWHCGDTSDLANGSGYWWHIPRMLGIELSDYIFLLKDNFHATNFSYNKEKNVLLWHWKNYADCHKFVLYVNKKSRERSFFI